MCCFHGRVHATAVLPVTSQLVAQCQQVSSVALAAKASASVRCTACRTAVHGQAKKKKKKITSFGQSTSLIARESRVVTEPQRPCQTSFIYVKLDVSDLQIETPCQHHLPQPRLRLSKGQIKSKPLTQRSHLHMESKAIINIVYRHRVITEARQSVGKGAHKPRN